MPTITPVLQHKKRKDGTCLIMLRIHASTMRHKSLKLYVLPEHWLPSEGMVSKKHPHAKQYNEIIEGEVRAAEKSLLDLQLSGYKFSASDIKAKSEMNQYLEFTAFALRHNSRYKALHTIKRKKYALGKLLSFCPQVTWHHFKPSFFRDFIAYLESQGIGGVTIHDKFKYYKQLVREAQDDGVFQYESSPFKGIKFNIRSDAKPALSLTELNSLKEVRCTGWIRKAQSVFLLQFYLNGMRIGDLLTLRATDVKDGKVYSTASKTGKHSEIALTSHAKKLIEELHEPEKPYLLPFITEKRDAHKITRQVASFTTIFNNHLKILASYAGVQKTVSTHMARRTWAQLTYDLTHDPRLVQTGLGHTSVTTTEQSYLQAVGFEKLNEVNRKLAGEG